MTKKPYRESTPVKPRAYSFYFARHRDFLEAGAVTELSASESTTQKIPTPNTTEACQLFWVPLN